MLEITPLRGKGSKGDMKSILRFAGAFLTMLLICSCSKTQKSSEPLICHVGGTMAPIMKRIAEVYSGESGIKVEINSAGSGELLAYIQGQKSGDVYVCHDPFIDILMQKWKMGVDGWQVAELTPVIVVAKGNPKKIKGIHDLTRKDVRVILTDYQLSSLGRMLPTIFSKAGIDFDKLNQEKKIITNKSGGYTANYVKMNNADAGMVWKAVWKLRDDALDFIPIDEHLPIPYVDTVTSATKKKYWLTPLRVTVATLKCSKQPEEARKFAEFIASKRCGGALKEYGFTMSGNQKLYREGEALPAAAVALSLPGKEKPVVLYAGAGMRRAVDSLIAVFKKNTGITVDADYSGSGIILARAVGSTDVDLFMPGDLWYLDQLQEKTGKIMSRHDVSYFVPTLIVRKGNPKNIKGLQDLTRSDLRVAFGEAKSCQVGRLTTEILAKNGIERSSIKAKESTTVNELGVWVKMNNADVAIVWDAIAANISDDVDTVSIPNEKNIISTVGVGLLRTSERKENARKFIEFMTGGEGRKILDDNGYTTNL